MSSSNLGTRLKAIQKALDAKPSLYLQGYKEEWAFEDWDMKDFILQFLTSLSSDHATLIAKTAAQDCKPSKRRSIGDIYRICKYYYNDVTLAEVQYWLSKLWKSKKIGYFYCNHNKTRVYMSQDFYKTHSVNPIQYGSPDEHHITPAEITAISNLKSYEEIV